MFEEKIDEKRQRHMVNEEEKERKNAYGTCVANIFYLKQIQKKTENKIDRLLFFCFEIIT
jgi:hypothetical protein